jgi:hypothetical protein
MKEGTGALVTEKERSILSLVALYLSDLETELILIYLAYIFKFVIIKTRVNNLNHYDSNVRRMLQV